MKRLAIYARVSTDQQTVEPQLHALREYATRRAWEPVEYVDAGVSGAKDRRPALDQLLADCRKRNVDAVAVVRLDRLARSVRHLVTLAGELEALGIDLIATEQSIDTSTPVGRFTFTTLGAVAELERDLIRERVVAGVAAARRKGNAAAKQPWRIRALSDDGEMGPNSQGRHVETVSARRPAGLVRAMKAHVCDSLCVVSGILCSREQRGGTYPPNAGPP